MSSTKSAKALAQEALKQVVEGSESTVATALQTLRQHGQAAQLPTLFDAFAKASPATRKLLIAFFADIQDTAAVEAFVEYLEAEQDPTLRKEVLSAIWNSKLPFDAHLPFFVMLATSGDYLEAIDCLTILENMQGPFDESSLLEAQLLLKEYLEEKTPQQDQKAQVMSEIAYFIKEQNEGVDADLLLDDE
ncbi:MAG: hypothetical protein RLZZ301_754 [Bacteroidota bacterium]